MKKCLMALLLLSNLAFADEQPNTKIESSLENRKSLKYQVIASPFGVDYFAFHSNLIFGAGYFLDEHNLINLRYSIQNSGGLSKNDTSTDYPQTQRAITISDRYYIGNSFNVMGSVYWREHSKYDRATHGTYYFKDYGVGARIGNEWQWQNFTMGTDWIGINHSLITVNNTFPENGFGLDKKFTMTYLSFYLGYSF